MRIKSISIENFRAIKKIEIKNLPDAVVIAGPNGCGKSSVFDALRLLKSAYGQYYKDEYSHFFSEFKLDVRNQDTETDRMLYDPNLPLSIKAEFQLSELERQYLKNSALEVYRGLRWSNLLRTNSIDGDIAAIDPARKKADGAIVEQQAQQLSNTLLSALDKPSYLGHLTKKPGSSLSIVGSPVLELLFSVYKPNDLGVIEYQSPYRSYGREEIGSVNLRIQEPNDRNAQSALYNTANKYNGIKTEMAQSFVTEILAEKAGVKLEKENTLKSTLTELFASFFPGKKFLGAVPTADGRLEFPVELESGRRHDINDLSSGEKEILLGYLRLRNSVPSNSIILFDEPEMHLNPRLSSNLPRFYEKHIGRANSNQIWLVTHSDAILREAVQEPAYAVFHMRHASEAKSGENQIDPVETGRGVESAIINLVGDLATYSPRSKIVLLEGEDSEFDARMLAQLFPEFSDRVNLVSMGNKRNVTTAHSILESAAADGKLDARFFSIVDRDFDGETKVDVGNRFVWDRYHIENYLLEPKYIQKTLLDVSGGTISLTEEQIFDLLKEAAEKTIQDLVRINLQKTLNTDLVGALSLAYDRQKLTPSRGFAEAIARSMTKLKSVASGFSQEKLDELEACETKKLQDSLAGDDWISSFSGREILKRFVDAQNGNLSYQHFRNLIIARMRETDYQPNGIKSVVEKILTP